MKPPKTPIEFDYDLWKTEDGICMVRVKLTGEECCVDEQTFRLLRNEEKRLRRMMSGVPIDGAPKDKASVLSTSFVSIGGGIDIEGSWLIDPVSLEDAIASQVIACEFIHSLTELQKDVYEECLLGKESLVDFATRHGVEYQAVQNCIARIRKKAKKFFEGGL